jgi:starch-binding outer membrane protein, SusD/RagB family
MQLCKLIFILILTVYITGCKKLMNIPPPVGTIITSQVFSTDGQAASAAANMYYGMINARQSFASSAMTILAGMSADELITFDQAYTDQFIQFQLNELIASNSYVNGSLWSQAYSTIYNANAILAGLTDYSGVHDSVKNELTGEAEFVRAFCDFYLVNLFGDIPLVTSINWQKTNLLVRTPATQIYQAILADLKDAQQRLPGDYSAGNGQRIVPNKWAATALLARLYLYTGDYVDAETQADSLINNSSLYSLMADPNAIFLINSNEAIWQLQQSNSTNTFTATPEGYWLIPRNATFQPNFYLTPQLLNAFESGDIRRAEWVDSTIYGGITYYYPYKYKTGSAEAVPDGTYTEYYMVLRLGEQYLIRAESRAQQNDLSGAIADLNIIRTRAGLPNTSAASQQDLLTAIAHERQIELFAEWGHRWLDLKRTGNAGPVLSPIKPAWTNNAALYPIPLNEIMADPNLIQNTGY